MPNLTTTIEDSSPIIVYSNGWRTGSSSDDALIDKYSESSYTRTNVSQASANFSFYGNGVQIFGAKRQNFSRYQIAIDWRTYPINSASVSSPEGQFQTSLFNTIALPLDYHTVQITNIDQAPLDLDYITWQTPVGSPKDAITAVTAQDSESSFEYIPPSQWSPDVPNPGMFSGGSGHVTYTAGSSVKFTFRVRSAVQLFGPVGPNCAPYSVSLDSGTPINYSPYKPLYRREQLLFQASNLGAGDHSITIRSGTGTNSTIYFAIDYVQVFSPSSGGSALSVAQIVGIVVGSVCGLLLLGALIFLLRSKRGQYFLLRKKQDRSSNPELVVEPFNEPQTSPATSPPYDTLAFNSQRLKGQPSHGSIVLQYSQPDQPLTGSSFSGENLYGQSNLTPFPLSPILDSTSPTRTPRILDEKIRPPSDSAGESTAEMAQRLSPLTPIRPTFEASPPVYMKS